jgi:putative transposase
MIRDSGSNFTAAFDAVLADAGIQTVLCNIRTPLMSACRTLDRGMPTRTPGPHPNLESGPICGGSCAITRSTTISTGRAALYTAPPLNQLPEPVDLNQHHVCKQTRVGGLINEYRLVA